MCLGARYSTILPKLYFSLVMTWEDFWLMIFAANATDQSLLFVASRVCTFWKKVALHYLFAIPITRNKTRQFLALRQTKQTKAKPRFQRESALLNLAMQKRIRWSRSLLSKRCSQCNMSFHTTIECVICQCRMCKEDYLSEPDLCNVFGELLPYCVECKAFCRRYLHKVRACK